MTLLAELEEFVRDLSLAKMVMGLRPTLHHENRLSSPRADARPRR